ncbi:hypothetical protein [Flavobacterium sp.]|jgi:hypothetical protein|uniref:hypothetical protein n=1 Tax=Flavobacterium sp. TaxID=239 RepID=UPI0033413AEC
MKSKYALISMIFGLAIVFAITLQSVHSYDHITRAFSEKQCHHKYAANKTEIGHSHHDSDHCFVCEFTLSSCSQIILEDYFLKTHSFFKKVTFFHSTENISFFSGCIYSLRGPPL